MKKSSHTIVLLLNERGCSTQEKRRKGEVSSKLFLTCEKVQLYAYSLQHTKIISVRLIQRERFKEAQDTFSKDTYAPPTKDPTSPIGTPCKAGLSARAFPKYQHTAENPGRETLLGDSQLMVSGRPP